MHHSIDQNLCSQCGLCIAICPEGLLAKNVKGKSYFLEDRVDLCVMCGHCMAVCETRSVHIEGLSYKVNFPELPSISIDYQTFMDFLKTRRSVRIFKDKPVPEEMLAKIIDAISLAPYGVCPDNTGISVVTNKEVIRKALPAISKTYRDIGWMMSNPIMRWTMKRFLKKEDYSTVHDFIAPRVAKGNYDLAGGLDDISRDAPALLLFHGPVDAGEHTVDSHICTTYAFLAAHSLGLGATVIGLIGPAINRSMELKSLFKIPQNNEVIETIIVGFPKFQFKRTIVRPRRNVTYVK